MGFAIPKIDELRVSMASAVTIYSHAFWSFRKECPTSWRFRRVGGPNVFAIIDATCNHLAKRSVWDDYLIRVVHSKRKRFDCKIVNFLVVYHCLWTIGATISCLRKSCPRQRCG